MSTLKQLLLHITKISFFFAACIALVGYLETGHKENLIVSIIAFLAYLYHAIDSYNLNKKEDSIFHDTDK